MTVLQPIQKVSLIRLPIGKPIDSMAAIQVVLELSLVNVSAFELDDSSASLDSIQACPDVLASIGVGYYPFACRAVVREIAFIHTSVRIDDLSFADLFVFGPVALVPNSVGVDKNPEAMAHVVFPLTVVLLAGCKVLESALSAAKMVGVQAAVDVTVGQEAFAVAISFSLLETPSEKLARLKGVGAFSMVDVVKPLAEVSVSVYAVQNTLPFSFAVTVQLPDVSASISFLPLHHSRQQLSMFIEYKLPFEDQQQFLLFPDQLPFLFLQCDFFVPFQQQNIGITVSPLHLLAEGHRLGVRPLPGDRSEAQRFCGHTQQQKYQSCNEYLWIDILEQWDQSNNK